MTAWISISIHCTAAHTPPSPPVELLHEQSIHRASNSSLAFASSGLRGCVVCKISLTQRNQYYKCHCDKSQTPKITGTTEPTHTHTLTRQYHFPHAYLTYYVQNLPSYRMYNAKQLAVLSRDLSVACASMCVHIVFLFHAILIICTIGSNSANIFTHFKIFDDENNGMCADVIGGVWLN